MSVCPKCGAKIPTSANFCPSCGASLKAEQAPAQTVPSAVHREEKAEKQEKGEKHEKREKAEKYEKREHGYLVSLITGSVLIILGVLIYLEITLNVPSQVVGASILIIIGIIVILVAVYAALTAARRHPPT
jgi:uncharacterized membrane protein YvbJ